MTEIFRGRRLWIETKKIRLPTGVEREKVIVHPSNAVAIFPVDGDRCKLLKQYRYAIDQYIIEAPAGTMEQGEEPLATAGRELIEETGFTAKTIEPKGFIYTTPGFTDEKIFLFEARGLSPSQQYGKDEDEVIEVIDVAVKYLPEMIRDGRIVDGKTICLIQRCLGC
ncbi:NUDIX hydrolase [Methanoregula formicica]|uniref:NTP pyrophosphohydrolase n=1 Tax=Methanoregula formicica (strain DSM 22288 / NBRC 105244 / SMSP) TaxID=593750 RepID=L0HJ67_METFS|nr:NUDIX hydrolase [Methanoregula formicica]AGB03821.1 NTP pyrophosphohydrolase [Methanoregula formicica SMSP]